MRCIEMFDSVTLEVKAVEINRNMRCIEIFAFASSSRSAIRLIEI